MSKPFDTTLKQLLDTFARDWIRFLAPAWGLPADVQAVPVDVDLSTVQMTADKVFQLQPASLGMLHVEPQASRDSTINERLLCYNSLIRQRHGGPVQTVLLLLRREAQTPQTTGLYTDRVGGEEYLRFVYRVIRLWELSEESLLQGPLGVAPLALLTDQAGEHLKESVEALDRRLDTEEADVATRRLVLTSSYILLGLRYDISVIDAAFTRTDAMKESVTYQAILREGEQKGEIKGRQEGQATARQQALLDVLSERFGVVSPELEREIRAITDIPQLQSALKLAVRIASLDEFVL